MVMSNANASIKKAIVMNAKEFSHYLCIQKTAGRSRSPCTYINDLVNYLQILNMGVDKFL